MASLPRSCCRQSSNTSVFLYCHFTNPKLVKHSLRTYATPQNKPLRYKPSAPKPQIQRSPKSTPATTFKPPIPLQSISQQVSDSEALNPPSTTHPPPLDLPSREPDTPNYKYYYRLGKAYATFYKTGLKAIWTNYKAVRALDPPSELDRALYTNKITRANFQLIRRSRADTRKIPPFILLWVVCGEFTPLVVFYVSAIVPRTIWIPKQFEAARQKAEARRDEVYRPLMSGTRVMKRLGPLSPTFLNGLEEKVPPEIERQTIFRIAQSYGLYPAWWDRLFGSWIPQWEIVRRLYKYSHYIHADDFAIEKDGGVGGLHKEEVVRACEERAMDVLGRGEKVLRQELKEYFQEWKSQHVHLTEGPVYERWKRDGTGP